MAATATIPAPTPAPNSAQPPRLLDELADAARKRGASQPTRAEKVSGPYSEGWSSK